MLRDPDGARAAATGGCSRASDPGRGSGGPARYPHAHRCGADRAAARRGRARRGLGPARLPANPGVASPGRVDWLERRICRRPAAQRLSRRSRRGRRNDRPPLEEIERRARPDRAELLREVGRQARWLAEVVGSTARARWPSEERALELRAGAELERAPWASSRSWAAHGLADAIAASRAAGGAAGAGPRGDGTGDQPIQRPGQARRPHVRRLAAGRRLPAPRHRRAAALGRGARGLELPPRRKAEVEDRYLFSVCLSRPNQRACGCRGEAPTMRAAPARARPSSTTSASCSPRPPRRDRGARRGPVRGGRGGDWPTRSSTPPTPPTAEELRARAARPLPGEPDLAVAERMRASRLHPR